MLVQLNQGILNSLVQLDTVEDFMFQLIVLVFDSCDKVLGWFHSQL